jgi:hypothetical protein
MDTVKAHFADNPESMDLMETLCALEIVRATCIISIKRKEESEARVEKCVPLECEDECGRLAEVHKCLQCFEQYTSH